MKRTLKLTVLLVMSLLFTTNCFSRSWGAKMAKTRGRTSAHLGQKIIFSKPEGCDHVGYDHAYLSKTGESNWAVTLGAHKKGKTRVTFSFSFEDNKVIHTHNYVYKIKIKK